jgi:predicted TIM-barrel fold metal-dependent hydrolase
MADFFSCAPTEEAVLVARNQQDGRTLVQNYWRAANIDVLCLDKGHPPLDEVFSEADHAALGACRVAPMLRVELIMQALIAAQSTLAAVVEGLRAALEDIRGQGYVSLKSIVAYRTGLDIATWSLNEAQMAFMEARNEVSATGAVRLGYKPLLDTLLHVVFEEAARQEMPIQFHTGYGDDDADMLLANPLHLRAVLREKKYQSMPIVLLHESYPYTRQGAYLAAVYDNVYLDLSYGIPFLGYNEMLEFTRAAFDVAPSSKLLYSSDGIGVPELHWISARDGRRIIGQVLSERVASGELSQYAAEEVGVAVLQQNALRLYHI